MSDRHKTKAQLLKELEALRAEVASLKCERSQASLHHSLPTQRSQEASRKQYTILLIDDSEDNRSIYRHYLTRDTNGGNTYQVVEFDNGEDVLAWCQQQIPNELKSRFIAIASIVTSYLNQSPLQCHEIFPRARSGEI
ncbi:response regulator [Tumidithrix elongata]